LLRIIYLTGCRLQRADWLYLIMTIEIKSPVTKEKILQAFEQFSRERKKKSLKKHFGKLKRGFDGMEYQKQVRNEWT